MGEQVPGRPLPCGFCFKEDGEEVHPHPECTWTTGVMELNREGWWVPSIPLPFFGPFMQHCPACKKTYFTRNGYQGHYALVHIFKLDKDN